MSALHAAFVAAQADMPNLHKDSEADTGKFRYRYLSLEALLDQVRPVLNRHGLGLYQVPSVSEDGATLGLRSVILHTDGETLDAWTPLAVDAGANAQAQGSAITYARRYAVLSMLGLAPDEDDDGAKAEGSSRGEAGPTADAPAQVSPSEDPSTFKAPATEKPATQGVLDELNTVLRLLDSSYPEHPGEGRTWVDVAKGHIRDTVQKESVRDLSLAEANDLIRWLEDQYQTAAREASIPFEGPV